MKNYVITCGCDCDGAFSADVTKYTTEEVAAKAAQHSNEWSDGIGYGVADEEQAKRFAETYGLRMPNYAFDEEQNLIPDEPTSAYDVIAEAGWDIWPDDGIVDRD